MSHGQQAVSGPHFIYHGGITNLIYVQQQVSNTNYFAGLE